MAYLDDIDGSPLGGKSVDRKQVSQWVDLTAPWDGNLVGEGHKNKLQQSDQWVYYHPDRLALNETWWVRDRRLRSASVWVWADLKVRVWGLSRFELGSLAQLV